MKAMIRPAVSLFVVLTVVTGIVYPLAVTGVAKAAFPHQAAGSLIVQDGKTVGSSLIGQNFTDPKYFWPRPSATSPYPYNASASSGSNLGPTNPALTDAVAGRIKALRDVDPGNMAPVLSGSSPIAYLTRGGLPAYATLLRQVERWAVM